ncbi:hypothetical protein MRB53_001189 [Persea americana]|uniref:Uncharacterized protein n=1 Tax=Persea americana TaxID=3435 RepID=A0ACC2MR53_PERAE|nr:hypothetical protein MRB53_001189 [Persea americana]|eukprot:TRINITY_DN23324_c0_g1_i5.p1 TRINITY_DN23324_c0_g1~~TRINITY_DN23324_c0_g1_i5.p1  ORF type:complete len:423 (+),score=86.50 TRINITY_DN23324_c0_g1_i5:159-1427(+)
MALYHLPTFSYSSDKFRSFFTGTQILKWEETHCFPPFKILTIDCSGKKSRGGSEQLKATRTAKSNAELCNELREFNSMAGLPENHVPSMKELCQHGRKDLANIVRRRGYKLLAELLMNITKLEAVIVRNNDENQDTSNGCGNDSSEALGKRKTDLVVDSSSSCKAAMVENYFPDTNGVVPVNSDLKTTETHESSISSSLHKRAAAFIKNGELETVEGFKISKEVALPLKIHTSHRDNVLTSEGFNSVKFDNDLVDQADKRDNQIEIDRLKAMLREKESELSHLKQQIKKEKLALSSIQEKANIEIGNAQRILSIKDAELHATEESLSGLKEVQIDYWETGETVEVAGSFNGWHHPIKMDLRPSAETMTQNGSSKSVLWSTVLWLYPGIYEIKFIIDGHWRINSQREFITRGNIQNNILRVER